MNNAQKMAFLVEPQKARRVFQNELKLKISGNLRVNLFKKYTDWRSYSLVAVYSAGKEKFIGVANSDGKKLYPYRVSKVLFPYFQKSAEFDMPQPLGYIKSLGLFLRSYQEGKNFGGILRAKKFISQEKIARLARLILFLQSAKTKSGILKKGIDFGDIEKDIKILKQRKREKLMISYFPPLKARIRSLYRRGKSLVAVHGDFNPYNLFFRGKKTMLIDFEKAHLGDKTEDAANILAQMEYSQDFNIKNKERRFFEERLLGYLGFSKEEQKRLELFKRYFRLLIIGHIMAWGDYQTGERLLKKQLPI